LRYLARSDFRWPQEQCGNLSNGRKVKTYEEECEDVAGMPVMGEERKEGRKRENLEMIDRQRREPPPFQSDSLTIDTDYYSLLISRD
jgi:hypothetical protein